VQKRTFKKRKNSLAPAFYAPKYTMTIPAERRKPITRPVIKDKKKPKKQKKAQDLATDVSSKLYVSHPVSTIQEFPTVDSSYPDPHHQSDTPQLYQPFCDDDENDMQTFYY